MTNQPKTCPHQQPTKVFAGKQFGPTSEPTVCSEKACALWMEIPVNVGPGQVENRGYCADVAQALAQLDLMKITMQMLQAMTSKGNIILPGNLKLN